MALDNAPDRGKTRPDAVKGLLTMQALKHLEQFVSVSHAEAGAVVL